MPVTQSLDKDLELIELWGGAAKDACLAEFITGVASILWSLKGTCGPERDPKRMRIWSLIQQLQCSVFKDPPYDQKVANQIRIWLNDHLNVEGIDLTLDFERLLFTTKKEAEAIKQHVARIKEAQEEQRKREGWVVIEREDAVEEWDLV
ncbi:hypothetical protein M406DRAFT_329600 [Cryphonectria parasitica EP155]|uniref:Uncharacterized protein n=1 Tax=Cryphonectria parasitica (strain ATCC 38755 / EP155) TaxID=660469 RepID=A0A9P4Y396_CRYP1|nr:uncharacterized protein M406DRAFT_329600 [Cryphonectria parasitica EP155]KAF3765728.1 hypothetical protein M406DRAFT_329600 [Cryphonectria parasitica EP155]